MSTVTLTDVDVRVRDAVLGQLEWDPQVDASAVGVTANGGAVTLTGFIDSYAGKLAAERAAKRARGVRAVANDIEVRLKVERTDADIAADVTWALELNANIPSTVQATVHNGCVTLTGKVNWFFQKGIAEKAIRHIGGVRRIVDYVRVALNAVESGVRHRIVDGLHRNANIDARHIRVEVAGDTVILTGSVGSWLQRESAGRAAADAPGVVRVDNRIVVVPLPTDATQDEMC